MLKLTRVQPLLHHRLHLAYADGVEGDVDLSDLASQGVFALWDQPGAFEQVRIGEGGSVQWGDDIDLCPDALYLRLTGQTVDQIFPSLRPTGADA